jgi:hypothetical protein
MQVFQNLHDIVAEEDGLVVGGKQVEDVIEIISENLKGLCNS